MCANEWMNYFGATNINEHVNTYTEFSFKIMHNQNLHTWYFSIKWFTQSVPTSCPFYFFQTSAFQVPCTVLAIKYLCAKKDGTKLSLHNFESHLVSYMPLCEMWMVWCKLISKWNVNIYGCGHYLFQSGFVIKEKWNNW